MMIGVVVKELNMMMMVILMMLTVIALTQVALPSYDRSNHGMGSKQNIPVTLRPCLMEEPYAVAGPCPQSSADSGRAPI